MTQKNEHILVVPFSLQGHINPMLQFSNRLASKGIKVTLIITTTHSDLIKKSQPNSIKIEHISDGLDEADPPKTMEAYFERFEIEFPKNLSKLIENLSLSDFPITAVVYDSLMPCVLEVAHRVGLKGGSFFTQSAAVCAIYRHMYQGTLKLPSEGITVTLPSLPEMAVEDMPSIISDMGSYPAILKLAFKQSSDFEKADWLFFNTFDKLENEVLKWMASQWPIKTIGPAVPSMYLDNRLEDNKDYGLSLFEPEGESCIYWLNTKETKSVVYVSFGSLANIGKDQMEELALGFMKSNYNFLWVVRSSETSKLPSEFTNRIGPTLERILVVNWSPQLQVLSHMAIGCFMTHCGWNSTLEALSLGVPLIAFPQWTDQTTNAKCTVDLWGAGVRVKVDKKRVAKREEIDLCVKKVMEGESGNEIRKNVEKWKELSKEAVDEGGSSDKNIDDFISELA